MDKPLWMWVAFFAVVVLLLALDLGVLHRKNREIGIRESLMLSAGYIAAGLLFGGWVWYMAGPADASLYVTGFLVEKSLSLDNIFVISLVFAYFKVPRIYQHRVLFWGIMGVIVLRGIMIGLGVEIVTQFHWVLYIFAAFLIFTGAKMLLMKDADDADLSDSRIIKFFQSHLRTTKDFHGDKFTVRLPHPKTGKMTRYATPLLLALVVIECVDLVFAVDSIPAILLLTTDPYIVYTSNIFAILGLRALYFALSAILARFYYLKYALALVLVFIGAKVFLVEWLDIAKMPPFVSLGVTLSLLAGGVLFSLYKTRGSADDERKTT